MNIYETDKESAPEFIFATVAEVDAQNGIRLKFDGETDPTDKFYKCNASAFFALNDRVKITKDSGTYVVDYVVGKPMEDYPIPSGGTARQLLKKGASDNTVAWGSVDDVLPQQTSQTQGKFLQSNGSTSSWAEASAQGLPSGGTTGQILAKSSNQSYDTEWKTILTPPSTGITGYYLKKTNSGSEWAEIPAYTGPTINGSGTSTLGFFGTSATSRKTVNKASTSATLAQLITAHNNLWQAMKDYGLINGY